MLATSGAAAAASAGTGAPVDRGFPPFAGNPCFAPDAAPGHQLEFNAYFDREEDALAFARSLPAEVFLHTLRCSVEGRDWILIARYRELP